MTEPDDPELIIQNEISAKCICKQAKKSSEIVFQHKISLWVRDLILFRPPKDLFYDLMDPSAKTSLVGFVQNADTSEQWPRLEKWQGEKHNAFL